MDKGVKQQTVRDLMTAPELGSTVTLLGWLQAKRNHSNMIFLDIADSTGVLQVVIAKDDVNDGVFSQAKQLRRETALSITGKLVNANANGREILAMDLKVIGDAPLDLDPNPRSMADPFNPDLVDQTLTHRHFYLRNQQVRTLLTIRHLTTTAIRDWFNRNGFIEFTAPILTPLPLYDDGTAVSLTLHEQRIFLTQCVGFYMEAAVHSFERIYNLGPSFRAEESRSRRHLSEYHHVKAEVAFSNREHIMSIVEKLIAEVSARLEQETSDLVKTLGTTFCTDGMKPPFPRISYREAIERVQHAGSTTLFGTSLNSEDELLLTKEFNQPLWVVGIPRLIEPFPYCIDPDDNELTMTADLISTGGFGELLGVAEKIHTLDELDKRMKEKGKAGKPEYEWVRELRKFGCVPHTGFGMGLERYIRWLIRAPHVRDVIPFPRLFGRKMQP